LQGSQSVLSVLTGWSLALLLGVRHASEPDHLVAVSTLVADQPNAARASLLGAIWGVGHSISLFVIGGLLLLFRLHLSARVADLFELAVATMLLVLGGRALTRALRVHSAIASDSRPQAVVSHHHQHTATPASHAHGAALRVARRPLLIGLVHGLAGSGALTALVLANMPTLGSGMIYMLCFGAGSVIGMAALTGLVGAPLRWLNERRVMHAALGAVAGVMSVALGVSCGWPVVARLIATSAI
jgi:high-affinity nickel-transport protein